jgi:hypothetical protein
VQGADQAGLKEIAHCGRKIAFSGWVAMGEAIINLRGSDIDYIPIGNTFYPDARQKR